MTPKLRRSVVATALMVGVATATFAPAASASPSPEAEVLTLVNQARAGAGCAALTLDGRLTAAAAGHSNDMATRHFFAHTTPDGVTFAQRITNAGYPAPGAENIAQGYPTAQQVMDGWLNSPGHKANIVDCGLKTMGVALNPTGNYWTQDFGR